MRPSTWTKEDVDTLVELWKAGVSSNKIAKKLNRRRSAITQYLCRNRDKLGLQKRAERVGGRPRRSVKDSFEIQWAGSVPFGHWTITKPWGKV
jgi:IS30 family transposase